MTSSERHLMPGQSRWDFSVQRYKSFRDVFCEKDLFSILFLACGRAEVTRRCLLSTVDAVARSKQEIEWILMENGQCDENYRLFQELPLQRKVVIRQCNFGINNAINQMWSISRGEYCCVLENDWENRLPSFNFVGTAHSIFQHKPSVAIVQLRAVFDPCENWGLFKPMYNPWSCNKDALENVRVYREKTDDGFEYPIGDSFYGFNNNPSIIRKSLYRECGPYPEPEVGTDARHGETFYQEQVLRTGCAIAHVGKEIYYHIGQQTTKTV